MVSELSFTTKRLIPPFTAYGYSTGKSRPRNLTKYAALLASAWAASGTLSRAHPAPRSDGPGVFGVILECHEAKPQPSSPATPYVARRGAWSSEDTVSDGASSRG